uniref:Tetratricopeptide repeat protein n=1 Tax=Acrobeloides nanus TaxID=290746 RepID=A0A914E1N4_9BILA
MARVYGTKSVEEALKHLLKVADCNPNDPFVYHAIGLQFHAIKCYKDALKYFLKAEEIKSGISSSNLFYIGDCLRRNGENEEAINYYKKSLCIPARNRVDYKGMCEARKALVSLGFPSDEVDKLTAPQNKTQSSI